MDPAAAVRQPGVRVCGLPARDGSASPDHRLLRLLADRRAAPISIALGTPRAANRGGDGRGAGGAVLPRWAEPEWKEVAPGISCKLLATDTEKNRVSMMGRLAPGTDYPPHRHHDSEELHLLYGELIVDDTKLHPGDYLRADADSVDHRVWSETGCTCVLLTSSHDAFLCPLGRASTFPELNPTRLHGPEGCSVGETYSFEVHRSPAVAQRPPNHWLMRSVSLLHYVAATIVMVAEAPCGSASTMSEQRRSRRRALGARRAFLHTPASFVVTWRDDARRGFYRSKAGKQHPARVRSSSDSCRSTRA